MRGSCAVNLIQQPGRFCLPLPEILNGLHAWLWKPLCPDKIPKAVADCLSSQLDHRSKPLSELMPYPNQGSRDAHGCNCTVRQEARRRPVGLRNDLTGEALMDRATYVSRVSRMQGELKQQGV